MPFDPKIFDEILENLSQLEIDEIKARLDKALIGYSLISPIFEPGAFVFRARKFDANFKKENGIKRNDLIQPPSEKTVLGRVNRPLEPKFYASMAKEAVFFELQNLKAGDELILSFWKTTERMILNNIGYTDFVFQELGAGRTVPDFKNNSKPGTGSEIIQATEIPADLRDIIISKDENRELQETFSKHFMQTVSEAESFKYKLTAAIGEMHLGTLNGGKLKFAGLLYPSTRMWANGDNVAFVPWFVETLEFRKAVHVRIKNVTEKTFDINYEDAAHSFDASGHLEWLGRLKNWTLGPGKKAKLVVEAGQDEDGDYEMGKDGPLHWVAYNEDGSILPRS